jgi:hypothetical protein
MLRRMAVELGWSESAISMPDRDLGMTGAERGSHGKLKTMMDDSVLAFVLE